MPTSCCATPGCYHQHALQQRATGVSRLRAVHYVRIGVEELDQLKLTPLLRLKYHDSIADAVTDLGKPDEIGRVFSGFQKYLYQETALMA